MLISSHKIYAQQSVLASEYSLKDQYSFNKVTTANYYTNAFKDRKRWFAIGLSYNMNLDEEYSLANHPFSMGWGVSAEFFITDYLSFYAQYTDSYIVDANSPEDNSTRIDKVFFGPRFYFNWLYFGLGAMTDYIFYKGDIFNHWDGYTEIGVELPITRFLSFEVNFRVIWGVGVDSSYYVIDHYDDIIIIEDNIFNYAVTLGFKFSI